MAKHIYTILIVGLVLNCYSTRTVFRVDRADYIIVHHHVGIPRHIISDSFSLYDTRNEKTISNDIGWESDIWLSPDGQEIAFIEGEWFAPKTASLVAYNLKTTKKRLIFKRAGPLRYFRWLPDGKLLVSGDSGSCMKSFQIIDANGQVTYDHALDTLCAELSENASYIALSINNYEYKYVTPAGLTFDMFKSPLPLYIAAFSPDNTKILYQTGRFGPVPRTVMLYDHVTKKESLLLEINNDSFFIESKPQPYCGAYVSWENGILRLRVASRHFKDIKYASDSLGKIEVFPCD